MNLYIRLSNEQYTKQEEKLIIWKDFIQRSIETITGEISEFNLSYAAMTLKAFLNMYLIEYF